MQVHVSDSDRVRQIDRESDEGLVTTLEHCLTTRAGGHTRYDGKCGSCHRGVVRLRKRLVACSHYESRPQHGEPCPQTSPHPSLLGWNIDAERYDFPPKGASRSRGRI